MASKKNKLDDATIKELDSLFAGEKQIDNSYWGDDLGVRRILK